MAAEKNPSKGQLPIPDIQVYARPLGHLSWTCPNCSKEHARRPVPWRRGDLICDSCQRRFRIGVGFNYTRSGLALAMGKFDGFTANRLSPQGKDADGRYYGQMEWSCPVCYSYHKDRLSGDWLFCPDCRTPIYVNLLIFEATKSNKVRAPLDWVVRPNAKESTQISITPAAFS